MIYIGADHRGFELKKVLKEYVSNLGYEVTDVGAFLYNRDDDYPDFAKTVAEHVAHNENAKGILICGSGVGVAIAANKIKGIRAGTALNVEQIKDSVHDENTNVLALSADYISPKDAQEIVKSFLESKFSGEKRHIRRVDKIKNIENG